MKLVLFDIDGTLLNTGAFGVKSLEKAAENITGKKPKYDLTKFIGMSDKHNFAYMYSCAAGKVAFGQTAGSRQRGISFPSAVGTCRS